MKTRDTYWLVLPWASGTYQHNDCPGRFLGTPQMFALVKNKHVCGGERSDQTGRRRELRLDEQSGGGTESEVLGQAGYPKLITTQPPTAPLGSIITLGVG